MRNISPDGLKGIFAQWTSDVFLLAITLVSDDLIPLTGVKHLRLCNDYVGQGVLPLTEFNPADVDTSADTIAVDVEGIDLFESSILNFMSTGTLPAPLDALTTYYVRNPTATTFQVATSPGGTPINLTSQGTGVHTLIDFQLYFSFPFSLTLPTDVEDSVPEATIEIDNVERSLAVAVRVAQDPIKVTTYVFRTDDPTIVEARFPDFELVDVKYDALIVRGRLSLDSFAEEPYPGGSFTPASFAGLF